MCKKPDIEPEYYWGEATAKLNGQAWKSKIRGLERNGLFEVILDRFNNADLLRETLYLYKIPTQIGTNKIYNTSANSLADTTGAFYATLGDDGDVVTGFYYVDENDTTHFVQITSYDAKTDIVEGTFQVSFIKDTAIIKTEPLLVDTLRFTNGRFKTKILVKDEKMPRQQGRGIRKSLYPLTLY